MMSELAAWLRRMSVALISLVGCGVGSCGPRSAASELITVHDSAGVMVVTNDVLRMPAMCAVGGQPAISIGSPEASPEYELYRVFGAARLSDGRIVLVNGGSQQLRFYDAAGRYLSSSGRAGRGPGEFQDAFYVWVLPGDTIWVGDYGPWQFQVFGPDGGWVRTVRPTPEYANPPSIISVLADGRALLGSRDRIQTGPAFELRQLTAVIHSPSGALMDTLGTFPNGRYGKVTDDPGGPFLYPLFESFASVTGTGKRIVAGHGSVPEYRVYEAKDSLRLESIVRWTTDSRSIAAADVDLARRRLSDQYKDIDPIMRRRLVEPLVSLDRPVAETFPAFSTIKIGRDGRTWVKENSRPQAADAERWLLFDATGAFQCTAALAPLAEVLEFGPDYVLALAKDSLGVERVVEYTIGPAADRR